MLQLKRRLADSFMYHGTKRDLELECVTTLSFGRSYDSILEQVRSSSLHWLVVMCPGAALLDHPHQPRVPGLPQDQLRPAAR